MTSRLQVHTHTGIACCCCLLCISVDYEFVILKIQYFINKLDRYPLRKNINKEGKKKLLSLCLRE